MSELSAMDGQRTGAILGFLRGVSWVRHSTGIPLRDTTVFWDGGHAQERLKLFPAYKSGRSLHNPKDKNEEEKSRHYYQQLQLLPGIIRSAGIRQVKVDCVEADDLISIFAHVVKSPVVIYSGDGDFHQLYNARISIFDPGNGKNSGKGLLGQADFEKKWGPTEASNYPLIKAMVGDASDAIPGVKGIGKVWASRIAQFVTFKPEAPIDWRFFRRGEPDEKQQKWIDKALAVPNRRIIKRNITLMRLPLSWEDSFYSSDQAIDAMTQWLDRPKPDRRAFFQELERYELHSVIENINNW
jgi:5'-3' exonuclease